MQKAFQFQRALNVKLTSAKLMAVTRFTLGVYHDELNGYRMRFCEIKHNKTGCLSSDLEVIFKKPVNDSNN